jgi:lipid A 3-O-deacylase
MGWDTKHIRTAIIIMIAASDIRIAAAQASGAAQVRVDNDGFDFWKRPARRSDGEYTNGVRITTELGRAPLWRRLVPQSPPCAAVAESKPRCSSAQITVGQEMYTPAEDSQPYTYAGWRSQRPYAGWLYGNLTVRSVRRSTVRSIGVSLGVTGPPSLADDAQRRAHRLMWRYASVPVGWETQVRFEPGVIVSAHQRWLLFSGGIGRMRLIDAIVGAGGAIGNVTTQAQGEADLRVGANLSHPWRRARRRGPVEILGTLGVRGRAVARNMFLDGNTLHPDHRVDRIPWVGDVHGSIGLRLGPLVLAYAVTEQSREYTTGPRRHTFGSLLAGIGGTPQLTP